MKNINKRKYLVDGRYQLGQAVAVILANAMVVLLIGALLSWYYLIAGDGSMVVNHNRQVPLYLTICLGIVVMLSLYFSLRRSRSTAGMMKKLHAVLENAGKGVLPEGKLDFRKSDYFRPLAVPLNACLDRLREKQPVDTTVITQSLEELTHGIDRGEIDPVEARDSLQEIIKRLRSGV